MKRLKLSHSFFVKKQTSRQKSAILFLLVILVYLVSPFSVRNADAVALNQAQIRFDRLATSQTDVDFVVMLEPAGASDEDFIDVVIPAGFADVDTTAANITTSTTGLPTGCTSLSTTSNQASAVTGTGPWTVEFTIASPANPTSGNLYCFYVTAGIDSPTGTGAQELTIRTETAAHAEIETTDVAVNFITNDQVTVSAVVPPTFTFTLGATSTSFTSDLSTSSTVAATGVTGNIVTNAGNGWTAYLRSANAGLDSVVTGDTIDTVGSIDNSPTAFSTGSEQYLLDVNETVDTQTNGSIDAEYDGSSSGGTFNGTALEPVASGTGATSSYTFTMVANANISGITQAANDYTDTWTVVAAGNF